MELTIHLKILCTLLAILHGIPFVLSVFAFGFGVNLGELSADKTAPIALFFVALGSLLMISAITIYFYPGFSATFLIFVFAGLAALAFWQFVYTGFNSPLIFAIFLFEFCIAGAPFMLLQKASS